MNSFVAAEDPDDVERLRSRLAEAEEALRAIRCGEIDALVGAGTSGVQLFHLNALIEEINEGVASVSSDGVVRYCNRRFAEMVHAPLEGVIGHPLVDFVVEEDRAACRRLLEAARRGPCAGELKGLGRETFWLSFNCLRSGNGRALSVIMTDQTETRREADELLRVRGELEERIRERTETLAAANRELQMAHVAALNMMKDAVEFSQALEVSNGELRSEVEQRRKVEEEVRRLNVELEVRVRRRTEELEAANHELEAFSYSVSHDLRAPLRSIEGFARILGEKDARSDEESLDYLARIQRAADRMSHLIDALLLLSRLGRQELHLARTDLGSIARDICAELREADGARDVEFVIPQSLPVRGDAALLRVALQNLLSNAWKFTATTAGARVEVGRSGDGAFFVRDNGVGFDSRYSDRLFVPFQRLHNERDFKGTGIGLAIVQRVIARHGGRVWGESQQGQGATFLFTLGAEPEA